MSRKKFKKLESCDPRVAAEIDKVFKEIDGPAIPEDCKYPELWYKCTEDLREADKEVTLAKVKSSYNKLLKEITEKKASFLGNTVIPELDYLRSVKRINIDDKSRTIEEFKRAGLGTVSKYLEMISPGEYKELVKLVKTSKKADRIGKKWDDMSFSQREKILTGAGFGNTAYQLAANSWDTLPQYVIDSIKQRLAKRKAEKAKKADADYDKYFKDKMKAKGITLLNELSAEEKKKFFNEVDKGWKAKNEKSGKSKKADADYDKYFEDKMKERGITSPAELSVEEKKKFFDEVDKGWKAKKETD